MLNIFMRCTNRKKMGALVAFIYDLVLGIEGGSGKLKSLK